MFWNKIDFKPWNLAECIVTLPEGLIGFEFIIAVVAAALGAIL